SKPYYPDSAFVAPGADIIGNVTLGEQSSVWFNTTIRGDVNWIEIGKASNVQDNTCIHVRNQTGPTKIGDKVTNVHNARIHDCTIHDHMLVGLHVTVLDETVVEPDVMIAAISLVPPGKNLKSGYLYTGTPVEKKRELSDSELDSINAH